MRLDFSAVLYDPVYAELGVPATFTGAPGAIDITVIDDTRPKTMASGSTEVRSVGPGAFARIPELTGKGIARADYQDAELSFNGRDWIVRSYELRGSPNGEDFGEVRFLLKETPARPPVITSPVSVSNIEGTVLAHTLTADQSVTWSIVAVADAARFELSGAVLRWAGNGVKDFEAPDDANADNAYVVMVQATNAQSLTTDQTITVTVTNVVETYPPVVTVAPVVTGEAEEGQTLTSDAGIWTGTAPITYTHQWYRQILAGSGATLLDESGRPLTDELGQELVT